MQDEGVVSPNSCNITHTVDGKVTELGIKGKSSWINRRGHEVATHRWLKPSGLLTRRMSEKRGGFSQTAGRRSSSSGSFARYWCCDAVTTVDPGVKKTWKVAT